MITSDQRAFKRVPCRFTIKYNLQRKNRLLSGTAISKNVSLGGVYFLSLERFEIGETLDCWIKMPGTQEEGKWAARVVRCEDLKEGMINTFGIAVEFTKSYKGSEKFLKKILEKNLVF